MNANIEHDLIVAEGTGAELSDEETDQVESLADKFDAEKMHERMMAEATKQAQKRLKNMQRNVWLKITFLGIRMQLKNCVISTNNLTPKTSLNQCGILLAKRCSS